MMRSLIAIAALVASSYASSNELEGKGIICKTQVNVGIKDYISPVTGTVYRGYRFIEGRRVNESLVRKSGLGMEIGRLYEEGYEVDTYREDVYEVRWGDGQHSLNRRTLELTLTYSGPDNFNYNPKMAV